MKNEVIEIYRGHKIRTYNKLQLRVSQYEFKKFIDFYEDHSLSVREVLENSGTPCDYCRNTQIIFYDKKDNEVKMKRGLLCK